MSALLDEIKRHDRDAASKLEEARFCNDSDIRSLTREDLHELFPGVEKLKLRKKIYDIIHKQKDINELLKEVKHFIPHESFRAALTNNGVLVDYLHMLKEMKTQMNTVQTFLDAHIGLLEGYTRNDHQEPAIAKPGPAVTSTGQTKGHPQEIHGTYSPQGLGQMSCNDYTNLQRVQDPPVAKVMYRTVINGITFGADTQLLDKVKDQVPFQLIQSEEEYKVIIVFCTISSRVGSDVEAVMSDIKGDEPVILVLMHHSRTGKSIVSRTGHEDHKIVLVVNTFFHDTVPGLVKCSQNSEAVYMIQNKLLEYKIQEVKDTSGIVGGAGCDSVGAPATCLGDTTGTQTRSSNSSHHRVSSDNSKSSGLFSVFFGNK